MARAKKARTEDETLPAGTLLVSAVIPGCPPSVNSLWRPGGRGLYKSRRARIWQAEAAWLIAVAAGKSSGKRAPYGGDAAFQMLIRASTHKRRDLDNMAKTAIDACVQAGVIADDSQIQKLEIERVFGAARDETEIRVLAVKSAG